MDAFQYIDEYIPPLLVHFSKSAVSSQTLGLKYCTCNYFGCEIKGIFILDSWLLYEIGFYPEEEIQKGWFGGYTL